MKLSSKSGKFISKPSSKINKELPLIAQIPFDELENPGESVEITPIACKNCSAVLMDVSQVKDDPKIGLFFTCQFCSTVNKLGSLPGYKGGVDVEYLIEKAGTVQDATTIKKGISGELVAAIIDVSGSMGGGKLYAVKHNLVETLKDMKINSGGSTFFLVSFESSVEIFLSPKERAIKISDDEYLHSAEKLAKFVRERTKNINVNPVEKSADDWISQVNKLRSLDMTALGPGLVSGIEIFLAKRASGRILLLTDGLANVGFGRLEGNGIKASRKFYVALAKKCLENNIVVDVVGVGGGNELALDILGKLCDASGGELYFVTREELDETFGALSSRQFVGRDVKVKVFTPESIDVGEISGLSAGVEKAKRLEEILVGSVTRDREALIKFDMKKEIKEEEVPVQVQVEFKDAAGNKKLRVYKTTLKKAKNEDEYTEDYDSTPLTMMKIQNAGQAYGNGNVNEAKQVLMTQKAQYAAMDISMEEKEMSIAYLDDELAQLDEYEDMKSQKAERSFGATMGLKRSRVSSKSKKKELEMRK
ncbi:MAG: hypothetical protein ACTSU9_19385 [Promethearchaeota archaeon]